MYTFLIPINNINNEQFNKIVKLLPKDFYVSKNDTYINGFTDKKHNFNKIYNILVNNVYNSKYIYVLNYFSNNKNINNIELDVFNINRDIIIKKRKEKINKLKYE